jgi:hypothetical protein
MTSSDPVSATLREVTRDHIIMAWKNVVFVIFRHETTLPGVAGLQSAYDQQKELCPEGVYLVTIVEQGAPMPSASVRDALAKFLASGAGHTRMSAVVHEGGGFSAAAVRGVVTGLALLARLPYPHRVFATMDDAADWFAGGPANDINSARMLKIVADARRRAANMEVIYQREARS